MGASLPPIDKASTHDFLDFNTATPQSFWEGLEYYKPEADGQLSKDEIIQGLLDRLPGILHEFYPKGKRDGNTYLIGNIQGDAGQSLKITLEGEKKGCWYDFDCPAHNGGVLDLFAARYGLDTKLKSDFPKILSLAQEWLGHPQRPILQSTEPTQAKDWGVMTKSWFYRDVDGVPIVRVSRYEKDGKKSFCPFDLKAKKYGCPSPRPLYNLPGIAQLSTVVFVEGEKCVDTLISLGICATTAMNGANALVDKTDWSPLRDKHVVVWPDNDKVGKEHGDRVVAKLREIGARSISLMTIPEGKPEGWDVADAVADGMDILAFMQAYSHPVTPLTPPTDSLPAFTVGQLLDDPNPLPEDLVAPRILTPGGLLVFGGAPKVGKTDLLLSWLAHMAAGLPFLGMASPRPLKIFCLQTEIMYDYLRERLKSLDFNPHFLPLVRQNLVMTPQVRLLLDEEGVTRAYHAITRFFNPGEVDVIVIDPLRNVYDPGKSGSENDNTAMLAFLQDRIEKLRFMVNPKAGIILSHHTKKITKKMLEEDPFQALSGAASLRSFYTTGLLLFRSDEQKSIRQIMFELRNGKAIPPKWVDKVDGRWREMEVNPERIVRKDYGAKLDAERKRQHDVIVQMILDEGKKGNLYTPSQFCQTFEGQAGLGQHTTIQDRINVLATKGFIKFNREREGRGIERSKYGVMCVEGMKIPAGEEADPETGEAVCLMERILPTHFKESQTGAILPVENPEVWVYLE